MENDMPPSAAAGPDPVDAREALRQLDLDRASLARRVVSPWWYHGGLGAIVFVMIASQALSGAMSIVLVALAIVVIPVLMTAYRQRYGVATTAPAGRSSRNLLIVAVAILVLGMGSALAIKLTGVPAWWGVIPAVVAGALTVVVGRRYDDALRGEIARGADGTV